jgi:hypothetical protein
MLSAVLRTQQAVDISLAIVRTFVKLRRMLATNEELARKVSQHDHEIAILFEHVQHLLEPEDPKGKTSHRIPRGKKRSAAIDATQRFAVM